MDSRRLALRSLACDASIFLLDDEPIFRSGSRETRTHKRLFVATCFQNRVLIQPDDLRPLSCGSWNRTNGLLVQSQASLPAATVPHCHCSLFNDTHCGAWFAESCGGRNRTYASWFKARHHYQQQLPRSTFENLLSCCVDIHSESALRESNPPRRFGRTEPLPLGQEHLLSNQSIVRHDQTDQVRTVGFEPTISCSQGTRDPRLPHILKFKCVE